MCHLYRCSLDILEREMFVSFLFMYLPVLFLIGWRVYSDRKAHGSNIPELWATVIVSLLLLGTLFLMTCD